MEICKHMPSLLLAKCVMLHNLCEKIHLIDFMTQSDKLKTEKHIYVVSKKLTQFVIGERKETYLTL